MKILLVVPCFNEEKNILSVIETLKEYPQYDYIIINDGSTDDTEEILIVNNIPHVSLSVNLGLSAAFQTGIMYAVKSPIHYDAVCQFDADGQHLPEYIESMASELKKDGDIIIGSRFCKPSKYPEKMLKYFSRKVLTKSIYLVTGHKISDPTSGLRMYTESAYSLFLKDNNLAPEPDGLVWFILKGFRVKEVPVSMRERKEGKSYLSFTRAIKYMINTISSLFFITWWRR